LPKKKTKKKVIEVNCRMYSLTIKVKDKLINIVKTTTKMFLGPQFKCKSLDVS